ncbi:hypothetical protein F5X99DRAFT_366591 [Biscogniauxia marginata]|nr:hypothetical protein F5X99DRAFT_366591 [Biscogniauxia marginata]
MTVTACFFFFFFFFFPSSFQSTRDHWTRNQMHNASLAGGKDREGLLGSLLYALPSDYAWEIVIIPMTIEERYS